MVVHPRLVGVLLRGRSNWKPVVETDIFVLQHHPRQLSNPYRIITRGFPHYRVAEGHSIEVLQEELEQLSEHARVSIQGKITSKKIADLLKGRTTPTAVSPPEDQSHQEEEEEDEEDEEDGYLSDLSTLSNDDNLADTMGEGSADADPDTYSHDVGHKSGGARLIRRAISFEDMSVRNIRRGSSEMRRLLLQNNHRIDVPERPASSASMTAVPNPSDTLPSSRYQHQLHQHSQHHPQQQHQRLQHFHHEHHPLQPPYELENRHTLHYPSSFLLSGNDITRPHSAMSMRQLEDIDTLFNIDRSTMRSNANSNYNFVPTKTRTLDNKSIRSTRTEYTTIPAAVQESGRDGKEAWGPLAWLGVSSSALDAIISWIEGPSTVGSSKAAVNAVAAKKNDKPNPILDIPFQFIALLTYPEPDPKLGGKTSLALVRETAFVRQRRKTLLMLTAYTLVVRYCSFDFFLVLLFASNCGMLFLMKNSGRMNVNMAKRAVNQRVGWAKQWAGGLFKRGGASPSQGAAAAIIASPTTTTTTTTTASNGNHSTDSASQQKPLPQQGSTHPNMVPSKSIPVLSMNSYMVDSVRCAPTVVSATGDIKAENAQEDNPQVKRRGLFSMRKTSSNNSSNMATPQNGSGTVAIVPSADGISGGDEAASLRTAATPKRGFFKRSTARSATAPLPPTNRIASSSESMATRLPTLTSSPPQSVSAVVVAPTPTPVTTARSEPILGLRSTTASGASTPTSMPSNLSQTQSLPQLQLLPMRSPSPSAVRKEMSWIKQQQHRHQPLHRQQQSLDSLPSSGSTSISSSPKLMPVALPLASPQTPQTQSQSQSYGRSLSSINPWTLLSGLSLSQRSQQQQPVSPPSVVSADPISVAHATPISPQPLNATGILSTSILAATGAASGTEGVVLFKDDSADVPSFPPFDYTLPATKHSSLPEPLSIPAFTDAVILEPLRHQQQQRQDTTMAVPYKVDAGEDVKQFAFVSADFRVEEEVMLDVVTRSTADDMEEV